MPWAHGDSGLSVGGLGVKITKDYNALSPNETLRTHPRKGTRPRV